MRLKWTAFLAVVISASAPSTNAAAAGGFYAGKTLTLIASDEAGGGYDAYTRLLAHHIQDFIPGKPVTVVRNEPGAGGLRLAKDLYASEPNDGSVIANLRPSSMLDAILGISGAASIDPMKYEWIGNMASDSYVCVFSPQAGVKVFADLQHKQTLVATSGEGAQSWQFPNAINAVLHTKMKLIRGYGGTGDRVLALERGEVQGTCNDSSTLLSLYPQLLSGAKAIPIIQAGLHSHLGFRDVPLTQSFATTDEQKAVLMEVTSQMDISRIFAAPPGAPKSRVRILRSAFLKALHDPTLRSEAQAESLGIDAMSGSVVEKLISNMAQAPAKIKAEARAAIGG